MWLHSSCNVTIIFLLSCQQKNNPFLNHPSSYCFWFQIRSNHCKLLERNKNLENENLIESWIPVKQKRSIFSCWGNIIVWVVFIALRGSFNQLTKLKIKNLHLFIECFFIIALREKYWSFLVTFTCYQIVEKYCTMVENNLAWYIRH